MPEYNLYETIGSSGLKQFSGYIYEEFDPKLTGTKAFKVFREMAENDPVVGSMLFGIESLFRQLRWDVVPVDQSEKHDQRF